MSRKRRDAKRRLERRLSGNPIDPVNEMALQLLTKPSPNHFEWRDGRGDHWIVIDVIEQAPYLNPTGVGAIAATHRYFIPRLPQTFRTKPRRDSSLQRAYEFTPQSSHAADDATLNQHVSAAITPDIVWEWDASIPPLVYTPEQREQQQALLAKLVEQRKAESRGQELYNEFDKPESVI